MSETNRRMRRLAQNQEDSPWHALSARATVEQARTLRRAIEMEEIRPYYQPIVDLRSRRILGFEVLARWISPHGERVGPGEFIPLAASAGLLNLLTWTLLRMACGEAAQWPSHLTLAINVAPSQFPHYTLPDIIKASARSSHFSLSRLVVEITEDVLRGSPEAALARTNELRGLGVQLAMDDFGIGDSNIRRLGLVEFDIIKIDRCVIQSITPEKRTQRGLLAAIAVGTSLGLQVIAEGIEEEWQAGIVGSLGCFTLQGWLTGRPMPASDVPSFIAANQGQRLACSSEPAIQLQPGQVPSNVPLEQAACVARTR